MLVVAGHIRVADAGRETVIAAARAFTRAARLAPGCISCSVSVDVDDPSLLHIFQEWRNQAAFDRHADQPYATHFQRTLDVVDVRERRIQRYEVSIVGAMPD